MSNHLTRTETFALLDSVAISSTSWEGLLAGNQKFYFVPSDFKFEDYGVQKSSLYSFDVWGTDDNGNIIIRAWSKW